MLGGDGRGLRQSAPGKGAEITDQISTICGHRIGCQSHLHFHGGQKVVKGCLKACWEWYGARNPIFGRSGSCHFRWGHLRVQARPSSKQHPLNIRLIGPSKRSHGDTGR